MKINGNKIAEEIKMELTKQVLHGVPKLRLAVIFVGSNPVSENFLRIKQKFGGDLGVQIEVLRFSEDVAEDEVILVMLRISSQGQADGIIVQLPLPKTMNTDRIRDVWRFHLQTSLII